MLADPAEWSVDPWSGELRDGEVWGRGALDMKSQVAANAVAIASLAREGFQPRRRPDLRRDRRRGGGRGRLLRPRVAAARRIPTSVRCDYAVNEGGGDRVELGGRVLYLCVVGGEGQRTVPALRVHGRSGHGSMPAIADNALVKAARLIERLGELRDRSRVLEPEVEARSWRRSPIRCLRPERGARARPRDRPSSQPRWSSRCWR